MQSIVGILAAVLAVVSSGSLAQTSPTFPSRPITIVVPFPPGSSTDHEIRIYQEGVTDFFKQQVLIDYKPGASNQIANSYVAKQKPDGYNLVGTVASSTLLPALKEDLNFDLLKELAAVSLTTRRTFVLIAHPGLPANNLSEFIAYAKANPGKLTWSTVGPGSGLHMAGEWLASSAGIKFLFVHYKGSAVAELDLMAGRIDATPKALISALPIIKSGKVKVIAIATSSRSAILPDVKTIAEQGFPGYDYPGWIGVMATGGTPPAILNRLSAAFKFAVTTPAAMKGWDEQGTTPVGSTPEEFRKVLATEIAIWKKLVKDNNIKAEE